MTFVVALFVGSGLGLAAAWCRDRGHRWGVVAGAVIFVAALITSWFVTGSDTVVAAITVGLLTLSFLAAWSGVGQSVLRERRPPR